MVVQIHYRGIDAETTAVASFGGDAMLLKQVGELRPAMPTALRSEADFDICFAVRIHDNCSMISAAVALGINFLFR